VLITLSIIKEGDPVKRRYWKERTEDRKDDGQTTTQYFVSMGEGEGRQARSRTTGTLDVIKGPQEGLTGIIDRKAGEHRKRGCRKQTGERRSPSTTFGFRGERPTGGKKPN